MQVEFQTSVGNFTVEYLKDLLLRRRSFRYRQRR